MKLWIFLFIGVAALALAVMSFSLPAGLNALALTATPTADPDWEALAPGIDYREYHLPDPNNVFVTRMEISNSDVTLESGIGSGYLASGLETVRSMAARYDQALSQWPVTDGWGSARSDVIVAINGDYYNTSSGLPHGGVIQGGWYSKWFTDYGGRTGFGWKFSRTPFMGECVVHRPEKQIIRFADGSTQFFQGINTERGTNQFILYTPHYDTNTRTASDGLEVVVDLHQPAIIYPEPRFFSGTVREIRPEQGSTTMLFDQIVLSAHGSAAENLIAHVQVGDVIEISQEITSRQEANCDLPLPGVDWSKTYASIGGDYYFLKEGLPKTYNCAQTPGFCNHLPRTAIAYNDQYVYFIVVDGRDLIDSIGMTGAELTVFARDILSATHGVTQDGGGSSTMVVNGVVVNNTFCNNYTCRSKIYLPLVLNGGAPAANAQAAPYPPPGSSGMQTGTSSLQQPDASYERGVANGMMMVVVEAEARSEQPWAAGQIIVVSANANLRLGPGSSYAAQAVIQPGASGMIQAHPLNGVQAKGYYWWKVLLDSGQEGWLVEEALATP